jgi:iron(III) transport system ATP-binding protein
MQDQLSHHKSPDKPWGEKGTVGPVFAGRLTFENVSFQIGDKPILSDINLSLMPGEITCLLGSSGCGKTTLLRLAAGIAAPNSGRILLDDREIAGPARYVPPERRGVGLMFQDYALFPHMTIFENVGYGLTALNKKDARAAANQALDRVGLSAYGNAYPHQLSGGEQQRVALARAIVPRPQVMLMDEPFSGLDQRLRMTVRSNTLAVLRESRATTMLVTHDPLEAMDVANRVILLRAGRIVQQASPQDMFNRPVDAEAARFFSDFNEFTGTIIGGKVKTPLGVFSPRAVGDGTVVTVMVRPQAVQLVGAKQGAKGRVIETRYLGDRIRCQIALEKSAETITALLPTKNAPKQNDMVTVAATPEDVLFFTSSGARPD